MPKAIQFSIVDGATLPLSLAAGGASEDDLAKALSTYEVSPNKDGEAFIPAVFKACSMPCAGDGVKCKGGVLHRLGVNVIAMTGLAVDLDHLPAAKQTDLLITLTSKGLLHMWWETYSHNPPKDCRMRVFFPFEELLPIQSPEQWSRQAWPQLMAYLGLTISADEMCRDPARIYFTPRKPSEDAVRMAALVPGRRLDWRGIVDLSAPVVVAPTPPAPAEDPSRPVDLGRFKERLKATRVAKLAPIAKALADGKALTASPKERPVGAPSRYEAWRTATSIVSNVAEGWESSKALHELLRPSWLAECADDPQDHTAWETIEGLLATARVNVVGYKAQKKAEQEIQNAKLKRAVEHIQGSAKSFSGTTPTGGATDADIDPETHTLLEGLVRVRTKEGGEKVKQCGANVEYLLRTLPQWRGTVRYNEATNELEIHGGPIGDEGPRIALDTDGAKISNWFARLDRDPADCTFGFHTLSTELIESQMRVVGEANAYNPLQDYLKGIKWDGVSRIDTALETYFGAETKGRGGEDITALVQVFSRKWFIAAVARALSPGIKMDNVLILEGAQGIKKTMALTILGGPWYSNAAIDPQNKDSLMAVAKAWIFEMGELGTIHRNKSEALKEFFSKIEDEFRKPYGRTFGKAPRKCVFVGTTNLDEYLTDETGNRRYWPIRCGEVMLDVGRLAKDRDQLWAEAVEAFYKGGEGRLDNNLFWLSEAEKQMAAGDVEARISADSVTDAIEVHFLKELPANRPGVITVFDMVTVIQDLFKGAVNEARIGRALKTLKFNKERVTQEGVRRYRWTTPEWLLKAPQRKPKTPQELARERAAAKGIHEVEMPDAR